MSEKKMTGCEILEEALRGCCSAYCDQYPRYEGEIDLGSDYARYMNGLIKRSKNPFQRYFNTVGRRIAGIAAVILIAFGCFMTVSAAREPVIKFYTNIYEKFAEIFFREDDIANAPHTVETVYILGTIPDGYAIDCFIIDDLATDMTWKNKNGDRIVLSQGVLTGSFIVDTEESDFDIIERNGKRFIYAEKYGSKCFFWNSEEYEFSLVVSDYITNEEAFVLIDSITKYNQ